MTILNREIWEKYCENFSIYDCAFGFGNRYCFLMYERQNSPHRDPLPETQFMFARMERSIEKRFYGMLFGHFDFAHVAYGESFETEFVAVDIAGHVYSYNPPRSIEEPKHPQNLPGSDLLAAVSKVVRIGNSIYTVGSPRQLHKRTGIGHWHNLAASLPLPKAYLKVDDTLTDSDWYDASGFSESDIYTVGGAGNVWHFDGSQWRQCAFISNERLYNVHCAADGNVYIGGNMGSLYVGKGDQWKKLGGSDYTMPWKDIAWFAGKLWCGSDYGLWELKNGKLERANIPADVQLVSGSIDISPDGKTMLTAGPDGAATFDGSHWDVLFSRHDFE